MGTLPKILLHACCAPCTPHVLNELGIMFQVHTYFYNPNIQPEAEYQLREREIKAFAAKQGFPLEIGPYDAEEWNRAVRGLEKEPEKGRRCEVCFRMRLTRTAKLAAEMGIPFFTTTLTVSPHKNAVQINEIGNAVAEEIDGPIFYEADFKQNDGFKISSDLSKIHNFYRQNYCGCIHSRRK